MLVITMVSIVRLAVPSLVMVTVSGELVEPDWMEPKSTEVGVTEISGCEGAITVVFSEALLLVESQSGALANTVAVLVMVGA